MQEAIPWWFYAFMVGVICFVGWLGYQAVVAAWALMKIGPFRKRVQEAGIPARAITFVVWRAAVIRLALFIFLGCGIWVIIRANFCSFRQLDISDSSIRLSYEFHLLNRELPLSSVRRIDLVPITHQRRFGLEVVTTNDEIYRSMDSDDEAVVSDCRRLIESFQKVRSNTAPGPTGTTP
jgi:hypothetical protein